MIIAYAWQGGESDESVRTLIGGRCSAPVCQSTRERFEEELDTAALERTIEAYRQNPVSHSVEEAIILLEEQP